jgi:RimJ/RimL family protein N-acetyltransferase
MLTRSSPEDVDDLTDAVDASLAELAPWMPWAQDPDGTREGTATFLEETFRKWDAGEEFTYTLRSGEISEVVGHVGLIARIGAGALEIGYWIHSAHAGRGLATEAARALMETGFALSGIDRIEIHCDEGNVRSARVARGLGCALSEIRAYEGDTPGDTGRLQIWTIHRQQFDGQPS